MTDNTYDVYFSNGEMRTFNGKTVVEAWSRGLSYSIVTGKDIEITHIINNATMQIYVDFVWDVSFTLKDTALVSGSPIKYNEWEVLERIIGHAKHVGNDVSKAEEWFSRNRKLKT